MAKPKYHITNAESGANNAFDVTAPGVAGANLVMDADAFLITPDTGAIVLRSGPWTAAINGKVTANDNAIWLPDFTARSTITIGPSAEITAFNTAVWVRSSVNITNRGNIYSEGGDGIVQGTLGNSTVCTIKNSGSIHVASDAILLNGGGAHTIINTGSIEGQYAIRAGFEGVEKIFNGGSMTAFVDLYDGDDVFNNFVKVKIKGHIVTQHGTLPEGFSCPVELGDGNDIFNGGKNAECVRDNNGADTYKFGGGSDFYIAQPSPHDEVDFVDGGAGSDTYDPEYGGQSTQGVQVNLDRVAHAGILAQTAGFPYNPSFPTFPEKVFNFENVIGSTSHDTIYGNAAVNRLSGNPGDDHLYGLAGNDVLDGGWGSDHLYGGLGRDVLTGGFREGPGIIKTFHFQTVSASGVTSATRDVVTDFVSTTTSGDGSGSKIDLTEIDAIRATHANDDFTFIGESKWNGVAGELRYVRTQTQTIVEGDVNGDAKADFSIALDGQHALTNTDFIGVV